MFQGFVQLESSLAIPVLARNSSNTPLNLDALPTYRAYGPAGLMTSGTGTASKKDFGSVTAATNASPIVITSVGHGLVTGDRVTISGALGNTAANGTFTIIKVSDDTFSLTGSTGNGAWTSGGTWNVSGLYTLTLDCTASNGYLAGETYTLLVQGAISSVAWGELHTFTVV